jgi:hypothetical protein
MKARHEIMRILFVDFDGVLHPISVACTKFCQLGLLAEFLREPCHEDIQLVISSSWREAHSLAGLRDFFPPDLRDRIIDSTPVLEEFDSDYRRGEEIEAWLGERSVGFWCALDDDLEGFSPRKRANLMPVDPATGLTDAILARLRDKIAEAGGGNPASG